MPAINHVLETCLYVEQLERSVAFYQRLFGFEKLEGDDRFCALNVSDSQVLLLFRKHATTQPIQIPGGVIPPHDGDGQLHLAFGISAEEEAAWTKQLKAQDIPIESRVRWPRGGFSLYFRDPDGHLLELVSRGCWKIY